MTSGAVSEKTCPTSVSFPEAMCSRKPTTAVRQLSHTYVVVVPDEHFSSQGVLARFGVVVSRHDVFPAVWKADRSHATVDQSIPSQ